MHHGRLWAVGLLFFFSGASSLGFEVIWSQQLARVLGGTTTSVAFVVALFMGGLAIGAAIAGRFVGRLSRPVVAYGLAEIGVAVLGLTSVLLLPQLELTLSRPMTFLVAGALLLPCTVLIGATLPLLIDGSRGTLGGALGGLYAVNTAGAVVGVLTTGLFMIGFLGLRGAASVLAAVGICVGAIACILGRRPRDRPQVEASGTEARGTPVGRDLAWIALGGLVGMASIAEEVLWTRSLPRRLASPGGWTRGHSRCGCIR